MVIVTVFLVLVCTLATWLPLIRTHKWWIRIFDFPRLQITVLAVFTLILVLVYLIGQPSFFYSSLLLILSAIIYQSLSMVRYTPLYPNISEKAIGVDASNTFSIMMSNVKMDNENYDKYLEVVYKSDPDVILLNEVNRKWVDAISQLDSIYPYRIKHPLENTYGMALYSKFKLHDAEINELLVKDIPSIYVNLELPSGYKVTLHCVHPEPPKIGSDTYERDTEILLIGKRIVNEKKPCVVVGDLNDVAWSYTSELFQKRCSLIDPREGRGFFNTYNVFVPLLRYPLDHFFYTDNFKYVMLQRLEAYGSDHFPMMLKLEYIPDETN
ncbi:endonuclease/exonuclease/phosphatase family protein [Anditalea andensis]|uniref:Endonuclease/exonuclease/phosphatase domain-containing protein n=1 Tax=Anditalea andensis TaxID=1048983 RepID=A0A074L1D5_9BACT|nr:endonuclease/exonuclease/phosphatase family protein [Anditalea andensis]KEO74984.1 hypothetical protein EL17_04735 [Anditalea andensis]